MAELVYVFFVNKTEDKLFWRAIPRPKSPRCIDDGVECKDGTDVELLGTG